MSENKPATVPSVDDVVLLPCPFCGGEGSDGYDDDRGCYYVECEKCAVSFESHTSKQRCVVGWQNRRAVGLVNWIEAEYAKSGTTSYLNQRCQALKECRKMVRRLLGQ